MNSIACLDMMLDLHGVFSASMLGDKQRYYNAIVEGIAAECIQNKLAIESAIPNLEEKSARFVLARNRWRQVSKLVLHFMRVVQSSNNCIAMRQAMFNFKANLLRERREFLCLGDVHERLSARLRNSVHNINAREALTAQLRENEHDGTTVNTRDAATVSPHNAHLGENEQDGIAVNTRDAATVSPHNALGDTESDTPHRDEADHNRPEPEEMEHRMDASQVLPDTNSDEYEQDGTAINARDAATVSTHNAQLRENEQGDTAINAREAVTAQLRYDEQGDAESDTRHRDEADHKSPKPEEMEHKMDASKVLPDTNPDEKA